MVMLNEHYSAGQVADYGRKSFALAKERHVKSIEDQFAACAEVREEHGLPQAEEGDQYAESQNHGGDEWWTAYPEKGLNSMYSERTRPVLTALMLGIVEGRIKAIVTWSTDRIHRDVGIASAFFNLLVKHKVRLFERNGEVPLNTPDAEAAYLNAAVAAQHYRKQCSVNSPRGIKRSAKKGIVVTDANTLGFRSGGRYSKVVIHKPEEQAKADELYDLCLSGKSYNQIAQKLMAEGYQWTFDLHEKRGKKRNEFTRDVIYDWQIRRVLTDPRYIGKQRQYKELWDCPAYLIDGKHPVIDPGKWYKVQDIINSRKNGGNAVNRQRPLTGLFRCGLCGQPLRASPANYIPKDSEVPPRYWGAVQKTSDSGYWCTHSLPSVCEDHLNVYINEALAPLLAAELRDQMLLQGENKQVSGRTVLLSQLHEAERYYEEVLPTMKSISERMLVLKEQNSLKEIADLRLQLREIEKQVMSMDEAVVLLDDYANQTLERQRDTLHTVIRWAALVPNYNAPKLSRGAYNKRPNMDGSKIVLLTSYGTYLTIVLRRRGGTRGRKYEVCSATPDELVGTIAEFPEPEGFLRGLERSWKGGRYAHNPDTVCPGYTRKPQPIAEFQIDSEDVVNGDDEADGEVLSLAA